MKRTIALFALTTIALTACGYPVRREKLIGGFVLMAVDKPEDLRICYEIPKSCIGGTPATVSRVGWNKHYIVAEQHPNNDKAISSYWIIDLTMPDSAMSGVTGPLTKDAFDKKTRELGLPTLSLKVDASYALNRKFKLSNYMFGK
jgi:hypothetical protein